MSRATRTALLLIITLTPIGCSALCGYHGNGCGYIAADKSMSTLWDK